MFELLNKLNENGVEMELSFNFCGTDDIICHFRKRNAGSSTYGRRMVIFKHELDNVENPDELIMHLLLTKLDEFIEKFNEFTKNNSIKLDSL